MVENFAPGVIDRMGLPVGDHPEDQPAHDLRLGEGVRARPLRGLQGVRERRPVHRRRRLDDRRDRPRAAGDRRADRRFRHRAAPRARHRRGAVPAQHDRTRSARQMRHAGRRSESVPRQAARPAAPRNGRAAHRVSAVPERQVRQGGAARRQRLGRRPAGLDRQVQGLGDRSGLLRLRHRPGRRVPRARQGDRARRTGSPIPNGARRPRASTSSTRCSPRSRNGP